MFKHWLSVVIVVSLCSCGVYLEYPPTGNNVQWKLVNDADTALYRSAKKSFTIDSVLNNTSGKVYYLNGSNSFALPANTLQPGINELTLTFFSNGKKRRSIENLYMVSDLQPAEVKVEHYHLIKHDSKAFTQGLVWRDGWLYESTGLVGESSLRIINPKNGDIIRKVELDKQIFAEGLTFSGNKLVMLTWKDGMTYEFSKELEQLEIFPFRKEGWGITTCSKGQLISSDGSNSLHYLSPEYSIDSTFYVYNHRGPVSYLNELECIEGMIWANVLGSDKVVVIQPQSGKVEMEIDLSSCIDRHSYPQAGVLNGIAYNHRDREVYLTGKNWPYIIVWQPSFFEK